MLEAHVAPARGAQAGPGGPDAAVTPTPREEHLERAANQFASIVAVLRVGAAALVIAATLRTCVFEPFNIPSESMLPTLLAGDYLFVAKWPYGLSRYSLPLAPALFDGRIGGSLPERGDVVVFKTPHDNRTDFIKRIVGLPGDRVRMVKGQIELNGRLVPKVRAGEFVVVPADGSPCRSGAGGAQLPRTTTATLCHYPRYVEQLGSRRYAVLDQIADDDRDDTPLVTVPPNHYFVEGDNRDDSADSRLSLSEGGVGMVPAENLVGRAETIFFSTSGTAAATKPSTWFDALRLNRIGQRL